MLFRCLQRVVHVKTPHHTPAVLIVTHLLIAESHFAILNKWRDVVAPLHCSALINKGAVQNCAICVSLLTPVWMRPSNAFFFSFVNIIMIFNIREETDETFAALFSFVLGFFFPERQWGWLSVWSRLLCLSSETFTHGQRNEWKKPKSHTKKKFSTRMCVCAGTGAEVTWTDPRESDTSREGREREI